jgi:ABC-2 type transport system permease protein
MRREASSAQQVRLVAMREIRERTRSRSFRVGTLVLVVLSVALAFGPQLLPDGDDPSWTVAVAGDAPAGLADAVGTAAAASPATVALEPVPGGAGPEALLEGDDDLDAVLVDGDELVVGDGTDDQLAQLMAGAVAQARFAERLGELGVDEAAASDALAGAPLQVRSVDGDDDASGDREALAFVGVIGLFVAIASYGTWVLNSVLEEKANRIVEVILTTVSPRQLLAGKVLGSGLVGLGQLLVVLAAVAAAAAARGALPDLPSSTGPTLAALVLWFVLGFAFYAVGYAAAASLVSRQEDAQSAVTPMIMIVMVAYFVALLVVAPNPDATAARVVSLLPPIAPLAMPARVATGDVALWETGLAVVLMLAAIWLMIVLAARIYANAILRTGARVPLREALRRGPATMAADAT